MARPTRLTLDASALAWDAKVNTNFQNVYNRPLAIAEHEGDESDLESAFPAAQYDRCLIWVDDTSEGWVLYFSNGSTWAILETGAGGGGGGGPMSIDLISGTDTIQSTENTLAICSGTTYTVTMPSASAVGAGHRVTVKRTSSGVITVDGDSSDTIDGSATFLLNLTLSSISLVSDGTSNWHIV
jgi:hypothetical protein